MNRTLLELLADPLDGSQLALDGDTLAFLESLGRPYLHKPFSLGELRAMLTAAAA